ncbi:hypothetical protein Plhal304r1_c011g0042711 [Plasmopara halstedii]
MFFRDKPCQAEFDLFAVHVAASNFILLRSGDFNDYAEKEEHSKNGRMDVDQGSIRQNVTDFVGHGLVHELKYQDRADKNDERVDEMRSSTVNSATICSSSLLNQDCVDSRSVIRRMQTF